jgi:predicted transcriptional regulator
MEQAVPDAVFTFRVDEDLKAAFGEAAKAQDQSAEQLLLGLMREYVESQQNDAEYDTWFRREVQIGLDSANAGNLISNDDVEAEFAQRREAARQKLMR